MRVQLGQVTPRRPTFDPVRVELWSGKLNGLWRYFVDYVERDGGRAGMWDGPDLDEARQAARECGEGGDFPVMDLTGAAPGEIPTGAIH
ncbi:MAG: hypothetical protein ACRYGP_16540 [Janthinobacterium lividum]